MGRLPVAGLLAMTLLGGCGFITQGTHPSIPVRSDPPGANVYVDGMHVGVTPLRLGIEGDTARRVEVAAEGHAKQAFVLFRQLNAAFVVLDSLTMWGLLVDGITQGWLSPAADEIHARLVPLAAGVQTRAAPASPRPGPVHGAPSGPEAGSRLSVPPGYR